MTSKTICPRHELAHRSDEPCPYCEPEESATTAPPEPDDAESYPRPDWWDAWARVFGPGNVGSARASASYAIRSAGAEAGITAVPLAPTGHGNPAMRVATWKRGFRRDCVVLMGVDGEETRRIAIHCFARLQ